MDWDGFRSWRWLREAGVETEVWKVVKMQLKESRAQITLGFEGQSQFGFFFQMCWEAGEGGTRGPTGGEHTEEGKEFLFQKSTPLHGCYL